MKKLSLLVSSLLACSAVHADPLANVGNSAFVYPGSYDMAPGVKTWAGEINGFNAAVPAADATGALTTLYVYASDLEFPCTTDDTSAANLYCTTPISNSIPSPSDPLNPQKQTSGLASIQGAGYSYGTPNPEYPNTKVFGVSNTQQMMAYYQSRLNKVNNNSIQLVGVVDGRIDNGYLQGFDATSPSTINSTPITAAQAQALADLVAFGNSDYQNANNYSSFGSTGICYNGSKYPQLAGVQMDLEPFDPTDANQQAFYTELAKDLAGLNNPTTPTNEQCSSSTPKFFSIFTFASAFNTTVGANYLYNLENKYHNFYIVDSLYDLSGSSNQAPITTDTSGNPVVNPRLPRPIYDSAAGVGYQTLVNAEVNSMLAASAQNSIPFQFAIPAAASVHEFENAYWRHSYSQKFSANTPGAGAIGAQIPFAYHGVTQLQYVITALTAINNGLKSRVGQYILNQGLFKGIVLWGFSPAMEWSSTPSIFGFENGTYWNGDNYAFFYPASPSARVLNFLATNDCLDTATIGTSKYPSACTTMPSN